VKIIRFYLRLYPIFLPERSLYAKKTPVRFGAAARIAGIRPALAFKAVFTRENPESRGALQGFPFCLKRRARDISAENICHARREDI
jgi:hypothetical protein